MPPLHGYPIVPPSLEDIGNSLLAVNEARKSGRPFAHPQGPAPRFNHPAPRHIPQQQIPQNLVPTTNLFQQMPSHSVPSTSSPNQPFGPTVFGGSMQMKQLLRNLAAIRHDKKCRKLLKTPTDSRWFVFPRNDWSIFRTGSGLK